MNGLNVRSKILNCILDWTTDLIVDWIELPYLSKMKPIYFHVRILLPEL